MFQQVTENDVWPHHGLGSSIHEQHSFSTGSNFPLPRTGSSISDTFYRQVWSFLTDIASLFPNSITSLFWINFILEMILFPAPQEPNCSFSLKPFLTSTFYVFSTKVNTYHSPRLPDSVYDYSVWTFKGKTKLKIFV